MKSSQVKWTQAVEATAHGMEGLLSASFLYFAPSSRSPCFNVRNPRFWWEASAPQRTKQEDKITALLQEKSLLPLEVKSSSRNPPMPSRNMETRLNPQPLHPFSKNRNPKAQNISESRVIAISESSRRMQEACGPMGHTDRHPLKRLLTWVTMASSPVWPQA